MAHSYHNRLRDQQGICRKAGAHNSRQLRLTAVGHCRPHGSTMMWRACVLAGHSIGSTEVVGLLTAQNCLAYMDHKTLLTSRHTVLHAQL